jgi:hypothetical protein
VCLDRAEHGALAQSGAPRENTHARGRRNKFGRKPITRGDQERPRSHRISIGARRAIVIGASVAGAPTINASPLESSMLSGIGGEGRAAEMARNKLRRSNAQPSRRPEQDNRFRRELSVDGKHETPWLRARPPRPQRHSSHALLAARSTEHFRQPIHEAARLGPPRLHEDVEHIHEHGLKFCVVTKVLSVVAEVASHYANYERFRE